MIKSRLSTFCALVCLIGLNVSFSQRQNIAFELNGRPSNEEILNKRELSTNPFAQFIGQWVLKKDTWIQNWGGQTDTLIISGHHTSTFILNTDNSLLSIIDGSKPNGQIYWTINPDTKEVRHLSSFGSQRQGVGKGSMDSKGNLSLNIVFDDEAEDTYRRYTYKWIDSMSYHMRSVQYDGQNKPTGLFYEGIFIKQPLEGHSPADSNSQDSSFEEKIKRLSGIFGHAIQTETLSELDYVFNDNTWILPEYHSTLHGLSDVKSYYLQFFNLSECISYQKEPFEVQYISGVYLELGNYTHKFKTPAGKIFNYQGKYLTLWKDNSNDEPRIMAHIWGANEFFEAENLDFIDIAPNSKAKSYPKTSWDAKIEEMRKTAHQAVLNGDTQNQLKTYTEDAIYMTYYDPPFIGKEKISEYFLSHNTPEVSRDTLSTQTVRIIDLDDYAVKFGEYYIEWTYDKEQGFVSGKGISILRKEPDGEIRIYRQMINHSHAPRLKSLGKHLNQPKD